MKFSAQEEYGLRCLIALAREGKDGSLTTPEIAEREGLTGSHVAKLLAVLRQAGFVESTRGQHGGYSLTKDPSELLVAEVIDTLGGRLYHGSFCDRHSGNLQSCVHIETCLLTPLWMRIQTAVDEALRGITLQDVLSGNLNKQEIVFAPRPPEFRHPTPTRTVLLEKENE